jgi:hypothetical protein
MVSRASLKIEATQKPCDKNTREISSGEVLALGRQATRRERQKSADRDRETNPHADLSGVKN